jgi:hypothetical protein
MFEAGIAEELELRKMAGEIKEIIPQRPFDFYLLCPASCFTVGWLEF